MHCSVTSLCINTFLLPILWLFFCVILKIFVSNIYKLAWFILLSHIIERIKNTVLDLAFYNICQQPEYYKTY